MMVIIDTSPIDRLKIVNSLNKKYENREQDTYKVHPFLRDMRQQMANHQDRADSAF